MRLKVEAYAGHTANERPVRFTLGDRRIEIAEILDRWYGDHASYFRVRGNDGHTYVLKYADHDNCWELASFTRQGSQGSDPRAVAHKTLH